MYTGTKYAVKSKNGLSREFITNQGLKQGCNLSPTLSNLFQNDLHDIFDQTCDPINIGREKINSLSWADDLLLISSSPEGLQESLNRLQAYCSKWGLTINKGKTKCMQIGAGRITNRTFYIDNIILDIVSKMKYLGKVINQLDPEIWIANL